MTDCSNAFEISNNENYVLSLTGEHNETSETYDGYTIWNLTNNERDSIWAKYFDSEYDTITATKTENGRDLKISCTGTHPFNVIIENYFNEDGTVANSAIKTLFKGSDENNSYLPVSETDILYGLSVDGSVIGYKVDSDAICNDIANKSNYYHVTANNATIAFAANHGNDVVDINTTTKGTKISTVSGVNTIQRIGKDILITENNENTIKILNYANNKTRNNGIKIVNASANNEENPVDDLLKNAVNPTNINGTNKNDSILVEKDFQSVSANKGNDIITINNTYKTNVNADEGNDTITVNSGYQNNIYTGKGKDTVTIKAEAENTNINILKGDGNLTVNYDNEAEDIGKININFWGNRDEETISSAIPYTDKKSRWADYTFEKVGEKDLKITATYEKAYKEKKAVVDTVTIKNAFTADGTSGWLDYIHNGLYMADYASGYTSRAIGSYIIDNGLVIKGNLKKNNNITGTIYNDIVYGGNKNDSILIEGGNNTIYTGKKGNTFIGTSNGNDTFHVANFNTNTSISDSNGHETLYFNSKNDDTYMFINFNHSGGYSLNDMLILSGKTLDGFCAKNFDANNYYLKKLNGIYIQDFFSNMVGEEHKIEEITQNGGLSSLTSDSTILALKGCVVDYLGAKNFQGSVIEFLQSPNYTKAEKKELLNIYKSVKCGTTNAETFNIAQSKIDKNVTVPMYIESMSGGDTFNFKNKFQDTVINASEPELTLKPSVDKINLANYSIDKGNLKLRFGTEQTEIDETTYSTNRIYIDGIDVDKKGNITDAHNINYYKTLEGNILPDIHFTLKDKTKTYNVESKLLLLFGSPIYDVSNNNSNNIAVLYGTQAAILTNNKYNIIYSKAQNTNEFHTNYGHDELYSLNGNCKDIYYVSSNKNSYTYINDAGNSAGDENKDKMYIISDNGTDDLRLFFNVSKTGSFRDGYDVDSVCFINKANMNSKNISVKTVIDDEPNGLGEYGKHKDTIINKGIKVDNMFSLNESRQISGEGDGFIEQISVATNTTAPQDINLDYWVAAVQQDVASWLSSTNYTDTMEVFEKGKKADINELLAVYNNVDYKHAGSVMGGV